MEQPPRRVGPELFPDVANRARREPARASPRRLLPRRHAGRQPRVLDEVVDCVPCVASPGGREMPVGTMGEKDGLECVSEARLDASLVRWNIVGALSPDRTEASL